MKKLLFLMMTLGVIMTACKKDEGPKVSLDGNQWITEEFEVAGDMPAGKFLYDFGAKSGAGKMAIVLPDGCFGNESLSYLRSWLLNHVKIVGVIDLPLETFLPNTGTKTSVLLCKKATQQELEKDYPVFMCIAETCGHDRRGKEIETDDIKGIPELFKKWCKENNVEF